MGDLASQLTEKVAELDALVDKIKFLYEGDSSGLVNLEDGLNNLFWAVHDLT